MSSIIKLISIPLGDDDIRHILGNSTKIIKYPELSKFNDLDELLPNDNDYCIILYEHTSNVGHWTALLKSNGTFEFFDAYGLKFDTELKWTDLRMIQQFHEATPYLSNLLNEEKIHL